jgi:hypothetical protein
VIRRQAPYYVILPILLVVVVFGLYPLLGAPPSGSGDLLLFVAVIAVLIYGRQRRSQDPPERTERRELALRRPGRAPAARELRRGPGDSCCPGHGHAELLTAPHRC